MEQEPIEVTAYKCPICNHVISENRDEARGHMELPTNALPRGFVYDRPRGYELVIDTSLDRNHNATHRVVMFYSYSGDKRKIEKQTPYSINAQEIRRCLSNRVWELLSPANFEELKQERRDIEEFLHSRGIKSGLIRTTDEIEDLIKHGGVRGR